MPDLLYILPAKTGEFPETGCLADFIWAVKDIRSRPFKDFLVAPYNAKRRFQVCGSAFVISGNRSGKKQVFILLTADRIHVIAILIFFFLEQSFRVAVFL